MLNLYVLHANDSGNVACSTDFEIRGENYDEFRMDMLDAVCPKHQVSLETGLNTLFSYGKANRSQMELWDLTVQEFREGINGKSGKFYLWSTGGIGTGTGPNNLLFVEDGEALPEVA